MAISKDRLINMPLLWQYAHTLWQKIRTVIYIILFVIAAILINKFVFNNEKVNNVLVLRYLNALEWPIVALIIGVLLRPFLPDLINRVRDIGPGGVRFNPPQQEKNTAEAERKLQEATEGDTIDLKTDIGRKKLLNNFQILWSLEKVYRSIYGTQIEVLILLNGYPNGLGDKELNELYQKHRALAPNPHRNLLAFMTYLSNFGLVDYDSVSSTYRIADIGRLFLDYLRQEGLLSILKPF